MTVSGPSRMTGGSGVTCHGSPSAGCFQEDPAPAGGGGPAAPPLPPLRRARAFPLDRTIQSRSVLLVAAGQARAGANQQFGDLDVILPGGRQLGRFAISVGWHPVRRARRAPHSPPPPRTPGSARAWRG